VSHDKANLTFMNEAVDHYAGQTNLVLTAYQDRVAVGSIEYTEYHGVPSISMVTVRPQYRRQGIATQMLRWLQRQYPDVEIGGQDNLTDLGAQWSQNIAWQDRPNPRYQELTEEKAQLEAEADRLMAVFDQGSVPKNQLNQLGDDMNRVHDRLYQIEEELHGMKPARRIFTGATVEQLDQLFPRAGKQVDGRDVRLGPVDNTGSIAASFNDYEVLPGVREIPMGLFGDALDPYKSYYAKNDIERCEELAEKIKDSGEISPLIIVVDHEGSEAPYILEGGHRGSALWLLGAKSFPALVVLDQDEVEDDVVKTAQTERHAYLYSAAAKRYLYHVTPYQNLQDIAEYGLKPHTSYVQKGKGVYLTEVAGLPAWWRWAYDRSGSTVDSVTKEHVFLGAVVLRTPLLSRADQLKLDKMGTCDAEEEATAPNNLRRFFNPERVLPKQTACSPEHQRRYNELVKQLTDKAKAYRHRGTVPPQDLQVWTGTRWTNVVNWTNVKVPYKIKDLFESLAAKTMYDKKTLQKTAEPLFDEGFVGNRWGSQGAGLLLTTGEKVLLLLRSDEVEEPGTWGISGGAVRRDSDTGDFQDLKQAALQEAREEMGRVPPHRIVGQWVYQEGRFRYTTFVGMVDPEVLDQWEPRLNWENDDYGWFTQDELADLDLHFGVVALLDARPDLVFKE
jgi:GNAT superfamily N-acetyltransferase/ADP-ribose pyrophosphatase YjhB (NUDIX family)